MFLATAAFVAVAGYCLFIAVAQLLAVWFPFAAAAVGILGVVMSQLLAMFAAGWVIRRTYPSRKECLAGLRRASESEQGASP